MRELDPEEELYLGADRVELKPRRPKLRVLEKQWREETNEEISFSDWLAEREE